MTRRTASQWLLCAVLVLAPGLIAAQNVPRLLLEHIIRHVDWPQQRNTEAVLSLTAVRDLLDTYREDKRHRITIRHPGGDYGDAWAQELRDWLVALGIPSAQVLLEPGSGGQDRIILLLPTTDV